MLEAELFAFLEGASDGVFAVRETGEICFWNRAAQELFGYPRRKRSGQDLFGTSPWRRGIGYAGMS